MAHALSKFFRGQPILTTRPGMGLIALLDGIGYEYIRRVRDAFVIKDRLALIIPDENIHVTLTQTTLHIASDGSYDPATLPHDLLHRMIVVARRAADEFGSFGTLRCTGELVVLGIQSPSHLAVVLKPENPTALQEFRKAVAQAVGNAMRAEAEAKPDVLNYDEETSSLVGPGWRLSNMGYIERKDYRMHATIGVLRTGNFNIDRELQRTLETVVAAQRRHAETSGQHPDWFHEVCAMATARNTEEEAELMMVHRMRYYDLYRTALAKMVRHQKDNCPFATHPEVVELTEKPDADPVLAVNKWGDLVKQNLEEVMRIILTRIGTDILANNPDYTSLVAEVAKVTGDVVDLSNINLRSVEYLRDHNVRARK